MRLDLYAGEIKLHKDEITTAAELALFVREEDHPELYKMEEGDPVEVGPFIVSLCSKHLLHQQQTSMSVG